jgi:hypothetical protein
MVQLNIPWAEIWSDLEAASCYETLNYTNRRRRRAAVRREPSIHDQKKMLLLTFLRDITRPINFYNRLSTHMALV